MVGDEFFDEIEVAQAIRPYACRPAADGAEFLRRARGPIAFAAMERPPQTGVGGRRRGLLDERRPFTTHGRERLSRSA